MADVTLLPTRRRERLSMLEGRRRSLDAHMIDIAAAFMPRATRFTTSDRNRTAERRNDKLYDNTGTRAMRVLQSGLMAGATSPARPWFRLTTPDPSLARRYAVRVWLDDVRDLMLHVFRRSNTYRMLPRVYQELAAFGTGVAWVTKHRENIIHLTPSTWGEYCLASSNEGNINTCFRVFEMTAAQLAAQFGLRNCSSQVQAAHASGSLDQGFEVVHVVEPRHDRNPAMLDSRNMAFSSVYFERGANPEQTLRESGFNRFPVLAPRWDLLTGDDYGISPAMDALGDGRQLQHEQFRKGQAIDFKTKPPLQIPQSMTQREVAMFPGGLTPVDAASAQAGVRSLFETTLDLGDLREDIVDVRDRINKAFFVDLFLMIANTSDTTQRTAAEIAERHEEKLLMLGPVLENLHTEMLAPLIQLTYEHCLEAGIVPPPPQELEGADLSVEFVSVLAQAQRAIGVNGVDRWLGVLSMVSQMGRTEVLDKVDVYELADDYADRMGVPPRMVVSTDSAIAKAQARDRALAAKEQTAMLRQQAASAKDFSAATASPESLSGADAAAMFSGVAG